MTTQQKKQDVLNPRGFKSQYCKSSVPAQTPRGCRVVARCQDAKVAKSQSPHSHLWCRASIKSWGLPLETDNFVFPPSHLGTFPCVFLLVHNDGCFVTVLWIKESQANMSFPFPFCLKRCPCPYRCVTSQGASFDNSKASLRVSNGERRRVSKDEWTASPSFC